MFYVLTKIMTLQTKLLIIIYSDKIDAKKETILSQTKPQVFI
jgi:hypothetical protein